MIMPYVETAVAFALVMLAGSLIVNILVRLFHHATHERSRGVEDMLGQLHRGFASQLSPPLSASDYATTQAAFLDDVLTSPILHDNRTILDVDAAVERAGAARLEQALAKRRRDLRRRIDFIAKADLLAIVRALACGGGLPQRWFERDGVDAGAFRRHVRRWFETAQATARQRFAIGARKASVVVAGVVVVLLNLDAVRLGYSLYGDRVLTERLVARQGDVMDMARAQVDADEDRQQTTADDTRALAGALQQAGAFLTVERVPIGWQDSWISKRWCAFHDACDDPRVPRPADWQEMRGDILMWLFGLAVSWVMLSLGAPFWVDILKKLSNLKNLVQEAASTPQESTAQVTARVKEAPGSTGKAAVGAAVQIETAPSKE